MCTRQSESVYLVVLGAISPTLYDLDTLQASLPAHEVSAQGPGSPTVYPACNLTSLLLGQIDQCRVGESFENVSSLNLI